MGDWQDKYIAFTKGLDLGSDIVDGDDLQVALNTDWDHEGTIKGRPSRVTPPGFAQGGSLVSSGLAAAGIGMVRDLAGERPYLGTQGQFFTYETSGHWANRGGFASARVDRPITYFPVATGLAGNPMPGVAQDFAQNSSSNAATTANLYSNYSLDGLGTLASGGANVGQGVRCGTTTAIFYFTSGSNLVMSYRTGGGAVNTVTLATDCAYTNDASAMLIPCASASNGSSVFWVAYQRNTASSFKVLKVSTTGSILASATLSLAGITGLWIDNSATQPFLATCVGSSGFQVRYLDPTTLGTTFTTTLYNPLAATGTRECAIGVNATGSTAWFVFRAYNGSGNGDLCWGQMALSNPEVVTTYTALRGGGTYVNAAINWGIAHQPIFINNRAYLTLVAAAVANSNTGTWLTIDMTSSALTLVARGPSNATVPNINFGAAALTADGSGFAFPTQDWSRFGLSSGNLVGLNLTYGLNVVTFQAPRTVQVGEATVFSGSVPHVLQRIGVTELGFPFLSGQPGCDATVVGGGAVGIGNYTMAAIWRWTDETGQVVRSAPSPLRTLTTTSGNNTMQVSVTNLQLTERGTAFSSINPTYIELYCTDINPTSSGALYLQQTVLQAANSAHTTITINTQPVTTTEKLYTEGGAFAQYHVPADGGVATLGRRLWLASGSTLYASKLIVSGWAPGFNDEGQLQVNIPPGAGRIMALEAMDNRLVVLCARGIYVVTNGGPDNTGAGPDFGSPERVADVGITHPRASCWTPKGIFLTLPSSTSEAQRGGPWLLDRGGQLSWAGKMVLDYCQSDSPQQLAYCPERDAVFMSYDQRSKSNGTGVVLMDLRTPRWAVWANRDSQDGVLRYLAAINGDLWTVANEAAPLNGTPGVDAGSAGAYTMTVGTAHLYVGATGLSWGRVRSLKVLGTPSSGAHTLTLTAVLDQFRTYTSTPFTEVGGSSGTTWPSTRQAPEFRLPTQKCSSVQVLLSASPATAVWSAVNLRIAPTNLQAPPAQRA